MLNVNSEIGRLRTVVVHLPGDEIDLMLPSMMIDLLFDDILFGDRAREEHRRLRSIIEYVADEVIEFKTLLVDVLRDDDSRAFVLADLAEKIRLDEAAARILHADSPTELAEHLIAGILRPDMRELPENTTDLYLLAPIPNFFFQRDPAVVVGNRMAIGAMATDARLREPLLASWVYGRHPRFRVAGESPILFHKFLSEAQRTTSRANPRPMFEGGDVLVPRADLLVIGASARTGRHTIERFAETLRQHGSAVERILIVELPKERSFMHLDTVFTQISRSECLIYEPAILPGEVQEVDVYELELGPGELIYRTQDSLLAALKANGIDLEPIACGGPDDPIAQQREQWTDGANAFALAPGVILCYERNVRTAEELDRAGYEVVMESDLLLGRVELDLAVSAGKKYAIQLQGHELPRARGGPRCLTMPLVRDPL